MKVKDFEIKRDQFTLTGSCHGNPAGIPILFLHGGPGYRCDESNLRYFNLNQYFVVFINQRGSSSSLPIGDIENNTTAHIIEDLEYLRNYLNIQQWQIYGQSWGATLALVYAIQFPQHVSKLIIKGVFLGRKQDIQWMYDKDKLGNYSPEIKKWHKTLLVTEANFSHPLKDFAEKILTESPDLELATKWAMWEHINCGNHNDLIEMPMIDEDYKKVSLAISRVEVHYFLNQCFLPDNYILNHLHQINCPVIIVQGVEDRLCPKTQALELFNQLKINHQSVELFLIEKTGHSTNELMLKKFQEIFS